MQASHGGTTIYGVLYNRFATIDGAASSNNNPNVVHAAGCGLHYVDDNAVNYSFTKTTGISSMNERLSELTSHFFFNWVIVKYSRKPREIAISSMPT